MDDELKILSAHAEGNPHPGTTYINVDGVTFQIQDKHVTVFFPENQTATLTGDMNAMGRVTFAKEPPRKRRHWGRLLLFATATTAVIVAVGIGWGTTRQ